MRRNSKTTIRAANEYKNGALITASDTPINPMSSIIVLQRIATCPLMNRSDQLSTTEKTTDRAEIFFHVNSILKQIIMDALGLYEVYNKK